MKREEILSKLGYEVPECKKKRVVVISDVNCEADDPFAIMHHLLTPSFEIKGIIACHFESIARIVEQHLKQHPELAERIKGSDFEYERGKSMAKSYDEGLKILELAQIDDIPLLHGSSYEISDINNLPDSEGADFIIEEAMKDDPRPLYVCMLGAETDLAIAYLKKPQIADKIIAVGILGAPYPNGGNEFNLIQDIKAVNVLFESPMQFYQIPSNVYSTTQISFAELVSKVKPCGEIGKWMVDQMFTFQKKMASAERDFPNSEIWSIGDNPTVGVLLQGNIPCWHNQRAPHIEEDGSYTDNPEGKQIRVYDSYDVRLTIHDLIAKLQLCYLD